MIEKAGLSERLTLPHKGFHRQIGVFAGHHVSPDGKLLTEAEWKAKSSQWLPGEADHAFVQSLMKRVVEPGQYATYIAPPMRGIDNRPADFAYVRFNELHG